MIEPVPGKDFEHQGWSTRAFELFTRASADDRNRSDFREEGCRHLGHLAGAPLQLLGESLSRYICTYKNEVRPFGGAETQ